MLTGEKKPFMIDTQLIDEPDMQGLGKILKQGVPLEKKDVSIYIIISEKMLCKKAAKKAKMAKAMQSRKQEWVITFLLSSYS